MSVIPSEYILWRHDRTRDHYDNDDAGAWELVPLPSFKWWKPAGGWIAIEGTRPPRGWNRDIPGYYYQSSKDLRDAIASNEAQGDRHSGLAPLFGGVQPIRYSPHVENPTLFLELLELEPTADSLRAFFDKWGPIFHQSQTVVFTDTQLASAGGLEFIERHGFAFLDICELDRARLYLFGLKPYVHLLEALTLGANKVREVLTADWPSPSSQLDRPYRILRSYQWPEGSDPFTCSDEHLLSTVRGILAVVLTNVLSRTNDVEPAVVLTGESGDPHLQLRPATLLGVIVLQFANAFLENRSFRQCESCQKWMEIASDARSQRKRFCSDACRMRAYRAKEVGA